MPEVVVEVDTGSRQQDGTVLRQIRRIVDHHRRVLGRGARARGLHLVRPVHRDVVMALRVLKHTSPREPWSAN